MEYNHEVCSKNPVRHKLLSLWDPSRFISFSKTRITFILLRFRQNTAKGICTNVFSYHTFFSIFELKLTFKNHEGWKSYFKDNQDLIQHLRHVCSELLLRMYMSFAKQQIRLVQKINGNKKQLGFLSFIFKDFLVCRVFLGSIMRKKKIPFCLWQP